MTSLLAFVLPSTYIDVAEAGTAELFATGWKLRAGRKHSEGIVRPGSS
jgi:hypothetical protein